MIYVAPDIYIDTNVLRDILEKRRPYSLFLNELSAGGEYRLTTTIVTLYETFLSESNRFKEGKKLGIYLDVLLESMKNVMFQFITVARIEGLMLRIPGPEEFSKSSVRAFDLMRQFKIDPTDSLHIALACEYKTNFFTTYDNEVLKMNSILFKKYGIKILRPESFVPVIYERLEEVRGNYIEEFPSCLKVIQDCAKKGTRRLKEMELLLLVNFLRRCFNYCPEEIHETLKNMIGYNREKTEAALNKYLPLILFCEPIKKSIPNICPHSTKKTFCKDSYPLSEDRIEDIIRIDLAKSKNSPFYYFIRKV